MAGEFNSHKINILTNAKRPAGIKKRINQPQGLAMQ
jgi:hypothetical protein